jgi:hypothetical protein
MAWARLGSAIHKKALSAIEKAIPALVRRWASEWCPLK